MRALDEAAEAPLTVVFAPAGYGKTTAIRQWVSRSDADVGWLSLDAHDNDPGRLAAHLLAALAPFAPGHMEDARRALDGGSGLIETVVPRAVNGLSGGAHDGRALVLDDYHEIWEPDCHALVQAVIDAMPGNLGVIVASRTPPPLRVARRRAAGAVSELGIEDLRFRRNETQRLLDGLGLDLTPAAVAAINRRIDGWPAGVALVATRLASDEGAPDLPDALRRSREFLIEEVLDQVAPALRDFLLRTSILPRLSPSLCEAVLEDPRAGELLAEAWRLNMFVTALNSEGTWLRYHEVFAAALRGELARESPDLVPTLHARASAWFEQAGLIDEAMDDAIAAGDGVRAAALLFGCWLDLLGERRQATVRRVLDRLPAERGELGPFCEALDVLLMIHEGVDQRITHERAEAIAREHPDAPGVQLIVDGVRISPFYGDIARAAEVGWTAWDRYADAPEVQEQIAGPLASVMWFAGDHDAVRRLLEPRVSAPQHPAARVWTLAVLSLSAADEGDSERALRYARAAMDTVEESGGETASEFTGVRWVLAGALRLRGRLAEAREHLTRALEGEGRRPGSVGHAVALAFDAELALAEGNRRRAAASARRARRIIERFPDLGTLGGRVSQVQAALARPDAGEVGSEPTSAERRVLELLPTDLTLGEIAEQLYISRNTAKSHVRRLYRRLGVTSREQAVAAARERGLLS